MDQHLSRRERLLRNIKEEGLDGMLVTSPVNVTYLTGFSGESSYLIVAPGKTLLVSDGRFTQQLAEECPGLATHVRQPAETVTQATGQVLDKLGLRNIGCESGHLTVAEFHGLGEAVKAASWKPARDRVEQLRAIKDAGEVEQIRAALKMAEKAFAMFRAFLRPQDTEKELGDALEMYVRRAGAKGTSFPTIVGVGERGALPHAPLTHKRVEEGPVLLVDWGAAGPFYKSDLTRVLLTRNNSATRRGDMPPRFAEVYGIVLEAQQRAIAVLRPGVKATEVDSAARGFIADAGFGSNFNHGLGHGFGLQIHEAPFLKPGSDALLHEGMVVTVEPGIYLPGQFGVRIEDDVLITAGGCEVLSSLPRDLEHNVVEF